MCMFIVMYLRSLPNFKVSRSVSCHQIWTDWIFFIEDSFRRVCIVAKSSVWLRHVRPAICLSFCPHVLEHLPLDRFPWNFLLGTYDNLSCRSKFGLNRAEILKALREGLSRFYCCWRYEIAIKALSSSEMLSGCQNSRTDISITRRYHNVTSYIHYISCLFHNLQTTLQKKNAYFS